MNFYVSRMNDTLSCGTPALAIRSIALASSPYVIGLMKPSGGGRV